MLERTISSGSGEEFIYDSLRVFGLSKTIFISDKKIWNNCKEFFPDDFAEYFDKFLLVENPRADDESLKIIQSELRNIEFILCLGSGTINDLCKYLSSKKEIPYAVFASAASMNGYLSKNASITIGGHKKTLEATLPEKVFCNLDILTSAPLELIKAGIGDSLCYYSCYFDWYLSHKILGTKFSHKPFEILQDKMEKFLKNYQKFSLEDEKFLQLLIEILLFSGASMTMAKGSHPASQSEHMIAHMIDMKYPKKFANLLHGQVIAVTTLSSAKIQGDFLENKIARENKNEREEFESFLPEKIVKQCLKEYDEKSELLTELRELSADDLKFLKKIHLSESKLREIFSHFKIKTSAESLDLTRAEYNECVKMAKFGRNRFTCLDLTVENIS